MVVGLITVHCTGRGGEEAEEMAMADLVVPDKQRAHDTRVLTNGKVLIEDVTERGGAFALLCHGPPNSPLSAWWGDQAMAAWRGRLPGHAWLATVRDIGPGEETHAVASRARRLAPGEFQPPDQDLPHGPLWGAPHWARLVVSQVKATMHCMVATTSAPTSWRRTDTHHGLDQSSPPVTYRRRNVRLERGGGARPTRHDPRRPAGPSTCTSKTGSCWAPAAAHRRGVWAP